MFSFEKQDNPLESGQCTCAVFITKIAELKMESLQHPSYSPDLTLSDYFLFQNLKKWLGNSRFISNEDSITQTNEYFPTSYLLDGIKVLKRWVELKGDELNE